MKNRVKIQIRSERGSVGGSELKSLGVAIEKQAKAAGAKCRPHWADGVLTISLEGLSPTAVEAMLTPFLESVRQRGASLSVVQNDVAPLTNEMGTGSRFQPGTIVRERLTRNLLFSLPEGAFVVSNLLGVNGSSLFAEQVGDLQCRPAAWKRAVEAGAAQRMCQVVWSKDDFEEASTTGPM